MSLDDEDIARETEGQLLLAQRDRRANRNKERGYKGEVEELLLPRERVFVEEYLKDPVASRAAVRAGYSKTTAQVQAGTWVRNPACKPRVYRAIQKGMDERAGRLKVDKDQVLREVHALAFQNVKNLFDDQGQMIPVQLLPDDVAASIVEITVLTDSEGLAIGYKYKTADKKSSLELLGKHLRLFNDQVDVKVGLSAEVAQIAQDMPADEAARLYKELLTDQSAA